MKKAIHTVSKLIVILSLSSCSTLYNKKLRSVRNELEEGNYTLAIKEFEKTDIASESNSRLLYYLEAGLLYHLAGDYTRSNDYLENSEWIADELYTKSLSKEMASLITSDNTVPYRGELYEYVYSNYYKILNYLFLGEFEDAMVEVRRLDHKLSLFELKDPFLNYISAVLYQADGRDSDAYIEYKKALVNYTGKTNSVPTTLARDISVFCKESNYPLCDEFPEEIRNSYDPGLKEYGSAVIILESGLIPQKVEVFTDIAIPQDYRKKYKAELGDRYYMKIAVPAYQESDSEEVTKGEIITENKNEVIDLSMMEDLGEVAVKTLEDDRAKIVSKAIARAISKYVAYKKVKGKNKEGEDRSLLKSLLAAVVNIAGVATEVADTRSWLTLPDKIYLSRLYLKPGKYNLYIRLYYSSGNVKIHRLKEFTVNTGEYKFLTLRK